jgi:dTDP-4-amino-4,6-dideoxy-D-galactose acyltransferase
MSTPPCEILAWDSEFFSCRVGRVRGGRLDRERLAAIEAWLHAEAVDCLYFLADSGDPATAVLAEDAGFRLVDVRVTLEREMAALRLPEAAASIRPARPEDVPELRRIAAASHQDSRFYADPHFDRGRCGELYATWIEKSCRETEKAKDGKDNKDSKDFVLVAEQESGPAGYISCLLRPAPEGGAGPEGEIGLLAVDAAAQGRGLGGALVGAALRWLVERRAVRVRVVTQGRNARAQRLYQAYGLLTRSIGLWFHRWPDQRSGADRETERE